MLAIIPARGGSKGLPNKNIRNLKGKPLIAFTIEAALNSECITKVIVSTDSEEIAKTALRYGAEVPFLRPSNLAEDTSLAIDNYIYTLNWYSSELNSDINEFCVLQPTSPLRTSHDINSAVALFLEKEADSVISYCEEHHSVFWHKYIEADGTIKNIFENETLLNRQDLKKTYYPNGAIYVFKSKLIQQGLYYSSKSFAYIMPRERSVDIDVIEDFQFAEFLMSV